MTVHRQEKKLKSIWIAFFYSELNQNICCKTEAIATNNRMKQRLEPLFTVLEFIKSRKTGANVNGVWVVRDAGSEALHKLE